MILEIALVATGAAAHLIYFNKGEHHLYGLRYLSILLSAHASAVCACALTHDHTSIFQAHKLVAPYTHLSLAGLYGSLIIYRLCFHPLRHFPGPFAFKLSSLAFSSRLWRLDAHRKLLALHKKHGDFVRIGSSDLSITHPKANEVVYGRGSKCTKADWYDLTLPMTSMQTTRVKALHDKRRRVWGSAFNDEVMKGYEGRIAVYQSELQEKFAVSAGQPVNVTELYHQFAFDVMGDLSFGASFNMLKSSGNHWAIKLLRRGMAPLGLMFPAWCFRTLLAIPGATGDWYAFKDYCCDLLDKRLKTHASSPNITSFLIEPWKDRKPEGMDLDMLQGDSQLIIVAGSDTTASTLTNVFLELAKQPTLITALRVELQTVGNDTKNKTLQSLKLLNAVLTETLRLDPPAGMLQRKTPPEGITIGDTFVPGNMTVVVPQYVVGRSEEAYEDAGSFRPERWFEKPEMVKEQSAWAPFSLGTYNCIGKPLGLMTLRTTVAKIVLAFDVGFADGDDGSACVDKATTQFNTLPGPLDLRFTKRMS